MRALFLAAAMAGTALAGRFNDESTYSVIIDIGDV